MAISVKEANPQTASSVNRDSIEPVHKKNTKKGKKHVWKIEDSCVEMYNWLCLNRKLRPVLQNGVDFLLSTENRKKIKLENHKWHNFKFGVYLLGKSIILTADCDINDNNDLGHLKLKTSYLWIENSCVISCSGLGYPSDTGPGKGEKNSEELRAGGGASHGSKGRSFNAANGNGKNGQLYGEDTLLKEIHFGSGGGCAKFKSYQTYLKGGNGGGIIEIIVQRQIINKGCIECDGKLGRYMYSNECPKQIVSGGGSGGSILIIVQAPHDVYQKFGVINCTGGGNHPYLCQVNKGGNGRIAIYTRCDQLHRSISASPPYYLSTLIPKEEFIMKRGVAVSSNEKRYFCVNVKKKSSFFSLSSAQFFLAVQ
ncbi:hypothetical protein RFI_12613 [Reticulomyxa filosa]|uniref:Uncharacterized protein n=1 Tax=Reticulomyxa filosa TaxID=46433 RepID=X6NF59_RETFI|nr:hypothetical protein RFI_12613 [Reticulomyxa filosa]|eukprot:ETO24543.1 hypothetical protein RFI_12613 [Reticulomyxa filosa]